MRVLRDPAAVADIADPDLRALLARRFIDICQGEPYDPDEIGDLVVVEPGDSLAQLEQATSCSIAHGRFSDTCYGDANFVPAWECLEEHPHCYEIVFVLSDSGFGVVLFVPKQEGIDPLLLRMCRGYGVPAPTDAVR
jgi:hypothetical protein